MSRTAIEHLSMPEVDATFDRFLDETYPRLMDGLLRRPGQWVVDPDMSEHLIDVFQVPLLNGAVDLLEEGERNQEYESGRLHKAASFGTSSSGRRRVSELMVGQSIDGRPERIEFFRERPLDEAPDTPPFVEEAYYARDAQTGEKGKFIDDLTLAVERRQLEVKEGQLTLGREETRKLSLKARFPGRRLELVANFTQFPTGEVQYEPIGRSYSHRGVQYVAKEPELTLILGQHRGVRRSLEPKLPLERRKR